MTPRCAQPPTLPAGCIQAQREELSRRILAGELDDAELQIRQPDDSPPQPRCDRPRTPVTTTTCRLRHGAPTRKAR
jgi:hypothetical protein